MHLKVLNVHERVLAAPLVEVGRLMNGLASPGDALWPRDRWPVMRFDRPLQVGAVGGHGPIRYVVEAYTPGQHIHFRFTGPEGFIGYHAFGVEAVTLERTRLRHVLEMSAVGQAVFTWSLLFRPLHDALIEDSLDCAERALGGKPAARTWSLWVRLLRRLLQSRRRSAR